MCWQHGGENRFRPAPDWHLNGDSPALLLALPGRSGLSPFFFTRRDGILPAMRTTDVLFPAIFRTPCNRAGLRSEWCDEAPVPHYTQRKDLDYAWIDQAGCRRKRTGRCGTGGLTRSRRKHIWRQGKMLWCGAERQERLRRRAGNKLRGIIHRRLSGQRMEICCQGKLRGNGWNPDPARRERTAQTQNLTGFSVRPA